MTPCSVSILRVRKDIMELNLQSEQIDAIELTTKDAAIILGLSPSTLKKWRSTKEQPSLSYKKRFSKIFYMKADVLKFKEDSTIS